MKRIDLIAPALRSVFVFLGILLFADYREAQGAAEKGKSPPIAWSEIADAISVLPPAMKGPSRGYYLVPKMENQECKKRIDRLKAKGDIIPPIVEALGKFKTGSEDGERTIFNLVMLLKDNPDERALLALERISQSNPTIKFRAPWLDGMERPVYRFKELAQEVVEKLRVEIGVRQWEAQLKGVEREAQIRRLADAWWLRRDRSTEWRAAGVLLARFPKTVWIETALTRAPSAVTTTEEADRAYHILEMIEPYIGSSGVDSPSAREFVERMAKVEPFGSLSDIEAWEVKSKALKVLERRFK